MEQKWSKKYLGKKRSFFALKMTFLVGKMFEKKLLIFTKIGFKKKLMLFSAIIYNSNS